MLETFSKEGRAKLIADASRILRDEAKFLWPSLDYHQDRILRLRHFLKWTDRRVRSIYNAEDGVSLRGAETLRIEEIKKAQEARERKAANAASNAEADRALEARIADLEAQLAMVVAALAGDQLAAHGGASRAAGGNTHQTNGRVPNRRSDDRKGR